MSDKSPTPTLDEIVALAKRRGFVYPTSEIYGGLANSYDYGPLGVELLRNIKNAWWKSFITSRLDMVGLDTQIIQHPDTWVASGHVTAFNDPLVEDLVTHKRYRADHLIEAWVEKQRHAVIPAEAGIQVNNNESRIPAKGGQGKSGMTNNDFSDFIVEDMNLDEMDKFIKERKILSPDGNPVSEVKKFNLLFESAIGSVANEKSKVYLRGETAQGIFTNFKQVLNSTRIKLPFGIGNIGRSFRNEVSTGQFIFRTLEFEQAEIEYFFDPDKADWQKLMEEWKANVWNFVTNTLGVDKENLRWRQHTDKERSHYSKDTYDLDYKYPFGFKELWGMAYRTDYDLKQHQQHSGQNMEYTDQFTGKKFIPHVIEPAVGISRLFLMVLCDAYWQDSKNKRTVLKLKPSLAPYQVAIFPLVKNKEDLVNKAKDVYSLISKNYAAAYDDRGNIGKRYAAQDEIGTPFCVTVDYETLEKGSVTVRHRDSTKQERVDISKLEEYLKKMID